MTCPECGQEITGLGKCWTFGCSYDARDEPDSLSNAGPPIGQQNGDGLVYVDVSMAVPEDVFDRLRELAVASAFGEPAS